MNLWQKSSWGFIKLIRIFFQLNKSFSGTLNNFKDKAEPENSDSKTSIDQFSSNVFEVIPEIEDAISIKSENQNETEEDKDVENFLKMPIKTDSDIICAHWLEYGCV